MNIFIDGDGCPVINITVEMAKKNSIPCTIICDTSHQFSSDYAHIIVVDKGADSADFYLVNKLHKGDIVVTQDYGLAAMCLSRGCTPISQNGLIFDNDNISSLLFTRYMGKKMRNAGKRTKGPKKRTEEQNIRYQQELKKLIENRTV